jgi:hypothetical protein
MMVMILGELWCQDMVDEFENNELYLFDMNTWNESEWVVEDTLRKVLKEGLHDVE